jgi:hypothetical protein
MIPRPLPSEPPYAYVERLRRVLGTDYVYLLNGSDVISSPHSRVDVELAQSLLDTAMHLVSSLPENLNGVVAEPATVNGKLHVYRVGPQAYVVAFVPEAQTGEGAVMRFEELVV